MIKLPKFNIEGQVHFVTTNVSKKTPLFSDNLFCEIIIRNLEFYRKKFIFELYGYVIMPDHLHLLIYPRPRQETRPTRQEARFTPSFPMDISKPPAAQRGMVRSPDLTKIEKIMEDFKKYTAKEIITELKNSKKDDLLNGFKLSYPKKKKHQYRIWQNGFYDFNIYSAKKFLEKLNYIHENPLRAGLVKNSEDWPYSSYRNYYSDDESLIKINRIGL